MTYYKAIRPDGTSWYDLGFRWVAERGPVEGVEVWHPSPSGEPRYDPARHLAASTEPADCSGMGWPSRLLEVEPLADVVPGAMRKVGCAGWRVVRELPAWQALGPCGREVVAYLALLPTLTDDQVQIAARYAAWDAAWYAAWDAAWSAAWSAAWDAAWSAAWSAARDAAWAAARDAVRDAAGDAAWAVVVRDMISTPHFATLTEPMRAAGIDFAALGGAS